MAQAIRSQTICRVVYRDAKGRFTKNPRHAASVQALPAKTCGETGPIIRVIDTGAGFDFVLVDPELEKQKLEARRRGDLELLEELERLEANLLEALAEDAIKFAQQQRAFQDRMRAQQEAELLEREKRRHYARKGGQAAAAKRKKQAAARAKMDPNMRRAMENMEAQLKALGKTRKRRKRR